MMLEATRVPSVSRAAQILAYLARERRPRTLASIACGTGFPKTSVQGICNTLVDLRLLSRGADGSFWLGGRVAGFGALARLDFQHTLRFGLLLPTTQNAYYSATLAKAEGEAHTLGAEILMRDAESDPEQQRVQWLDLLDVGVDALLVDAVDSNVFGDLLRLSAEADIPVIAIGSRVNGATASVTSDNVQAGLLAGHYLAGRLRLKRDARIAIVDGLRKNANTDRVIGFREAIREHPGIEIVDSLHASDDNEICGNDAAATLIARTPRLDGIFAVCDPIAFGVGSHISNIGIDTVVVSVDGRAEAIEQITSTGPIIATAAQDPPRIFHHALEVAMGLATGNPPVQAAALIPVKLITDESAARYTPWG